MMLDLPTRASGPQIKDPQPAMHYPKRTSKRKRVRQFGFRARMKTSLGGR